MNGSGPGLMNFCRPAAADLRLACASETRFGDVAGVERAEGAVSRKGASVGSGSDDMVGVAVGAGGEGEGTG
ncbi:hypothetical protein, partial [Thermogemmatispora sp.]|uniref:hypothetical protein n=1 Tax=Thermogemmatispora sp. TaxID=1968838 RepID=UPI00260BCD3A